MNRYYLSSTIAHLSLLGLLLWSPWMRRSDVMFIDGFDYYGDGGGGGGGGKAGVPEKIMGQPVPQPQNIPVPDKPAPVQEATKAEKIWNTKTKKTDKPVQIDTPKPQIPIPTGEKDQKETSNIVRIGVKEGTEVGTGAFDYGTDGPGNGPGVGIGIGPGEGGGVGGGKGFGFGSYLGIMRRRIWSEWTQSAVYGTDRMCVIGLTVARNGTVSQIKLEKSSGNPDYDNVALRAVRNSSPLPPLPAGFSGSDQRFKIAFRLLE